MTKSGISISKSMTKSGKIFLLIFLQICMQISATSSDDIEYQLLNLVRVYKNGTVERLSGTAVVPASLDPITGVLSKDIILTAPGLNVTARMYLPKNANPNHKLPLLVYYHGGAFVIGCACYPPYHNHLNRITAEANVVAISINYRLAPEYPLPICFEDSWLGFKWVLSHRKSNGVEKWLNKYADFGRVYVGGESAGGTIAHTVVRQAGLNGIMVRGLYLNCPYFYRDAGNSTGQNNLLKRIYPTSEYFNDPLITPAADPYLSRLGTKRVLVYVAGNDTLRYAGFDYKNALIKSKWKGSIELVDVPGQVHAFSIAYPNKPESIAMIKHVAAFLNHV